MSSNDKPRQHIRVELTVPAAKSASAAGPAVPDPDDDDLFDAVATDDGGPVIDLAPEPDGDEDGEGGDGPVTVPLSPVLDIAASEALRETLIEASGSRRKIVIDASAVDRLSTPCIQVLLAAGRTYREQGIEHCLFAPSDTFIQAFDDLGLFAALMEWKVEA